MTNETERRSLTTEAVLDAAMLTGEREARFNVMMELAYYRESYVEKLEQLRRKIDELLSDDMHHGIRAVHETVLSTSLIDDVKVRAAKIAILKKVAEDMVAQKDDEFATFMKSHLGR